MARATADKQPKREFMKEEEYIEHNYRIKFCCDSEHFIIESITPNSQLGHMQMRVTDGKLEIRDLWINNDQVNFRGKGFGSILVKHAFDYAKKRNINVVFGYTQVNDVRVHNFYRKQGFTVCTDKKRNVAWFISFFNSQLDAPLDLDYLAKLCRLSNEFSIDNFL